MKERRGPISEKKKKSQTAEAAGKRGERAAKMRHEKRESILDSKYHGGIGKRTEHRTVVGEMKMLSLYKRGPSRSGFTQQVPKYHPWAGTWRKLKRHPVELRHASQKRAREKGE